ncbi:MAG TPA: hypothetical protein DCE08_07410 [Ruminococcaceae bacterium]|nr:hypothetical protein [Oscillospiraceae bacterium]
MQSDYDISIELPMGFGFSLAQNPDAMRHFASMTRSEQKELIEKTHSFTSRRQMHEFVEKIGRGQSLQS